MIINAFSEGNTLKVWKWFHHIFSKKQKGKKTCKFFHRKKKNISQQFMHKLQATGLTDLTTVNWIASQIESEMKNKQKKFDACGEREVR